MFSPPESASLQALLTASAFAPITNAGWLRVTGEDRVRWLNGMTTNSILALEPGQGCYTFFLNAQGRIQADASVWLQEDAILLETGTADSLATMLDRFIIMDDVELAPVEHRAGLTFAGPQSASLLHALELTPEPAPSHDPYHFRSAVWQAQAVEVLEVFSPLVPTFELWADPATIGLLAESLRATGAGEATPAALNQLRVLSGIPLYGVDIRDRELPQETGQTRALHFSKGCYLGQEIVERIHSRGNVHRGFTGLILTGDMPPAGTSLSLADLPEKSVGELTSIVQVGQLTLALGYLRRDALGAGSQTANPGAIVYRSDSGESGIAVPCSLPFVG